MAFRHSRNISLLRQVAADVVAVHRRDRDAGDRIVE